jgi:hypothetical protein
MIEQKIKELRSEKVRLERQLEVLNGQIQVLEDVNSKSRLDTCNAQSMAKSAMKEPTEQDVIGAAYELIVNQKSKMERVRGIATYLRNQNYNLDNINVASILIKSGKFRINKDKKWEAVEEDAMFE